MDGMNRYLLTRSELNRDETVNAILDEVASVFNTDVETIKGTSRKRWDAVYPRHCAMYMIKKKYKDMTLQKVGSIFKGMEDGKPKDHATVLHACRATEDLLHHKWGVIEFIDKYDDIVKNLYNKFGVKFN